MIYDLIHQYGAYAEYTVALAANTFPIGPKTTYEDAATLPLAVMTAAIGLFVALQLPTPPESGLAPPTDQGIIIYGSSTSVGSFAVQLAKRAGFYVIGVAGDSVEYSKSIGVDAVVNYKTEKDLVRLTEVAFMFHVRILTLHSSRKQRWLRRQAADLFHTHTMLSPFISQLYCSPAYSQRRRRQRRAE